MPPEQRQRAKPEFQPERAESPQRSDQNADSGRVDVRPLQLAPARPENVAVLVTGLRGLFRLQRPLHAPHFPHRLP